MNHSWCEDREVEKESVTSVPLKEKCKTGAIPPPTMVKSKPDTCTG